MINVSKEQSAGGLMIRLTGSIEESTDFESLVGPITGNSLVVNCRGVSRINSIGVKAWIKYFQSLSEKNVSLTFQECSSAIVEQINLISNFTCGGQVESIMLPFACQKCGAELQGLFKVDILKQLNFEVPNLKCTKCGSNEASFDDIPEEYFNFLTK